MARSAQPNDVERTRVVWVMLLRIGRPAIATRIRDQLATTLVHVGVAPSVHLATLLHIQRVRLAPLAHVSRVAREAIPAVAIVRRGTSRASSHVWIVPRKQPAWWSKHAGDGWRLCKIHPVCELIELPPRDRLQRLVRQDAVREHPLEHRPDGFVLRRDVFRCEWSSRGTRQTPCCLLDPDCCRHYECYLSVVKCLRLSLVRV